MSTPPELPPVEVVLVTGPAGSGKTAFISACAAALRDDKTRKNVGYMSHRFVQEFGCTAPLPQPLARAVAESGFYSSVFDFGSGCVCCSPSGDFQRALLELKEQRAAAAGPILYVGDHVSPELWNGRFRSQEFTNGTSISFRATALQKQID